MRAAEGRQRNHGVLQSDAYRRAGGEGQIPITPEPSEGAGDRRRLRARDGLVAFAIFVRESVRPISIRVFRVGLFDRPALLFHIVQVLIEQVSVL